VKYFKILVNGKSCNGGKCDWSLPSKGKPGKWMPEIEGDLEMCAKGYHIVKAVDIPEWVKSDCEIYEVTPKGKVTYGDSKGICRSVRLVKRLEWDDKIARSFACDCAERVLPIYEKMFPKETRVRGCIKTSRKFIFGLATKQELAAAGAAAGDAAWAAARDAARDAAGDAAGDAAWAAARDAAGAAAGAAEKKWQTARLLKYLNGRILPNQAK
jgi:hypothetical protein